MARKYGPDFCIYCRKEACACLERRNNVKPLECAEASRLSWSLQDWCNHLKRTYGTRNKEKGIENVINRLFNRCQDGFFLVVKSKKVPVFLEELSD